MSDQQLELFGRHTSITFREAAGLYWEIEGKFLPGHSHKGDIKRLNQFFGEQYLQSVTPVDIQNFRRWRKLEDPEIRESTINRDHARITRIYNAFFEWRRQGNVGPHDFTALELPRENPGEQVKKEDERRYRRNRIVTPEEFTRFCDYAHPEVRKICTVAILTLLRRKDIQLLDIENLNRSLNTISGIQSKTGIPYNVPAPITVRVIFAKSSHQFVCDFTNWRRRFQRARVESGVYFQFRD